MYKRQINGRNEVPNTKEAQTLLARLRNAIVALGAIVGIANLQWSSLAKGLLEPEEKHVLKN